MALSPDRDAPVTQPKCESLGEKSAYDRDAFWRRGVGEPECSHNLNWQLSATENAFVRERASLGRGKFL